MKKLGRPRMLSDEDIDLMQQLRESKITVREIAEKFEVCETTVRAYTFNPRKKRDTESQRSNS